MPVPPEGRVLSARDLEQASERYLDALEAFGNDDPAAREKARRELEAGWEPLLQALADAESTDPAVRAAAEKSLASGKPLGAPANPYSERLDVLVLRKTRSADPAEAARAGEELRRKGRVHRLLRNFNTFDYPLWQKTRLELVSLGDYGASQCVLSLLRQLFLADARRQPLIRSEIAELGERAIPPVMEILRRRGVEKRRPGDAPMQATLGKAEQCIRILAELGPAARDELDGLAGEDDPSVRLLVAKALKDAKDPMGRAVVGRLLEDPEWAVRAEAAAALGAIGGPETVAPLARVLDRDADVLVRKAAARALGDVGDPAAIEPLFQASARAARAADPEARHVGALAAASVVRIARELARNPGREGTRALERLLREGPTGDQRAAAAGMLGEIGDVRAGPAVLAALSDPDLRVRHRAIRALGLLRHEPAVDPLLEILRRPGTGNAEADRLTAAYAAQALESISGQALGVDVAKWEAWRRSSPPEPPR